MALTISALFFCNHLWHLLCTFLCAEVFYISLSGSFIPTCIYGFPTFDLNFYIFFLGAIHKLHSSHHNGNEYTMAWVEILSEGTFLLQGSCRPGLYYVSEMHQWELRPQLNTNFHPPKRMPQTESRDAVPPKKPPPSSGHLPRCGPKNPGRRRVRPRTAHLSNRCQLTGLILFHHLFQYYQ